MGLEYQSASQADRRRDAREKIMLGGLMVKAGLRDEDRAVLYGGIMELAERLKDDSERRRLHDLGAPALAAKPDAKITRGST